MSRNIQRELAAAESISFSAYQEKEYSEKLVNDGWIEYGDDNLFPQYLTGLFNGSTVHSSLCRSIATMVEGTGLDSDNDSAKLELTKIGLDKVLKPAALDLKIQGGFYLEVKYNLNRQVVKVRHIPFGQIRLGKRNEDGEIKTVYHCLNWSDRRYKRRAVATFDPSQAIAGQSQILACLPYTIDGSYYPHPDYIGAVNWIEIDKGTAIFHNNNMANGLSAGFMISWKNGIPTKQKRDDIRRDIERQMAGPRNAGKFFMVFSDGGDTAPEFIPMELSQASEQFQFLSDESTNKIMIGHRVVSPAMFGVKTAGQLGATEELQTAAKLFNTMIVQPFQEIIKTSFESVLAANDITAPLMIGNNNPMLPNEGERAEFEAKDIETTISIIDKVKTGLLNESQGREILISMLGLSPELAEALFTSNTKLKLENEAPFMSDELGDAWEQHLDGKGELFDFDQWEVKHVDEVTNPHNEFALHLAESTERVEFFQRFANPDEKSKIDTGLYKIRYQYSQNLSDNSRTFCRNMVANSKRGVVYRFEDIQAMEGAKINSEFAAAGQDSYSIWEHKGGVNCHHNWTRIIYFRKRQGGKFLPNDGIRNDKKVAGTPDIPLKDKREGFDDAATKPIDTPTQGAKS